MSSRIERHKTLIGGIVIIVTFALVMMMAMTRLSTKSPSGVYDVKATFNKADGIGLRSPVRLSGVPVGQVVDYTLDDQYRAVVTMRLDLKKELPDDTLAAIHTSGILGSKYVELSTGGMELFGTIPSGSSVDFTQDSLILEELLEKIIAVSKQKRGLDKESSSAGQGPADRARPETDTENLMEKDQGL